jgi:hypothetical protein
MKHIVDLLRKRFSRDASRQRAPLSTFQKVYNIVMVIVSAATASSLITIVALKGK